MSPAALQDPLAPVVLRSRHLSPPSPVPPASPICALFLSAPYPGRQKFSGHPAGLLYALTVLADRKAATHGPAAAFRELPVWCPDGTPELPGSAFEGDLRAELRRRRPKIVGVSTFSVSYLHARSILAVVKEELPETLVIFGGAHEDNFVEYYNRRGFIDADFVIAGDAMFLLDELYRLVEDYPKATVLQIQQLVESQTSRFSSIPGAGVLLYNLRGSLRKLYSAAGSRHPAASPLPLDRLPILPRYLLRDEDPLSRSFSAFPGAKTAQMMLGQGCPYSCPFCSEAIKKAWFEAGAPASRQPIRHLAHVEAEIRELGRRGYSAVFFDDSTLLAKPGAYLRNLGRYLDRDGFQWGGQTTQASIHAHRELLPELADHGLRYLYVGIEHFDGSMIDTFGRKAGAGNKFGRRPFRETLRLLRAVGIRTALSLTFGHPDPGDPGHVTRESPETVRFAIDQAAQLVEEFEGTVSGVSLNLVTYHPGTVISNQFEDKGLGELDFVGHPNRREPFTFFEEGVGPHAPGVTEGLVRGIWSYARDRLGTKLEF